MPLRRAHKKERKTEGRLLSEIVKLNYVPNKVSRKNYYTIFRAALGGLSSGISLCSPPARRKEPGGGGGDNLQKTVSARARRHIIVSQKWDGVKYEGGVGGRELHAARERKTKRVLYKFSGLAAKCFTR